MVKTFIGLGSNLANPEQQIRQAIAHLQQVPKSELVAVSPLYKSTPLGGMAQPDYINAVAQLDTTLSPLQLLDALQTIETQQGRVRSEERWAARTIDLDLLLYDEEIINTERLIIPHPGLLQRSFVLYPLYQIAPDLMVPGYGKLEAYLAQVQDTDLEPISSV